ncbi:MAG: GGDEF domain-containing protein [Betaproteobacteria bacterium]
MKPTGVFLDPLPSQEDDLATLRRSAFLCGIADAVACDCLARARVRTLAPGETLIHRGVAHGILYVLLSGELSVALAHAAQRQHRPDLQQVAQVLPGATVGEQSILDGQAPDAWVVAKTPARLLAISEADTWQLMQDHPPVALNLMRILSARVRKSNVVVCDAIQVQERLAFDAHTDVLTGLHNRRSMESRYADCLRQAQSLGHGVALLMVDIDHFKGVNDGYGHAAGDEVLRQTAACIKAHLPASALLARYGGDEICVLLTGEHDLQACDQAQRVCQAVFGNAVAVESGRTVAVSVSIGVAHWDLRSPLQTLVQAADAALYNAKTQGRNSVVLQS